MSYAEEFELLRGSTDYSRMMIEMANPKLSLAAAISIGYNALSVRIAKNVYNGERLTDLFVKLFANNDLGDLIVFSTVSSFKIESYRYIRRARVTKLRRCMFASINDYCDWRFDELFNKYGPITNQDMVEWVIYWACLAIWLRRKKAAKRFFRLVPVDIDVPQRFHRVILGLCAVSGDDDDLSEFKRRYGDVSMLDEITACTPRPSKEDLIGKYGYKGTFHYVRERFLERIVVDEVAASIIPQPSKPIGPLPILNELWFGKLRLDELADALVLCPPQWNYREHNLGLLSLLSDSKDEWRTELERFKNRLPEDWWYWIATKLFVVVEPARAALIGMYE